MSGSSIYVQRADCRRHDTPIALVVIEADQLTPDERTALALLTSRVPTAPLSSPKQGDLARLCQEHGCALDRTAVIATTPQGLPLLLEPSSSVLTNPSTAEVLKPLELIRGLLDRKSTRLNSSHSQQSRMPSSA